MNNPDVLAEKIAQIILDYMVENDLSYDDVINAMARLNIIFSALIFDQLKALITENNNKSV